MDVVFLFIILIIASTGLAKLQKQATPLIFNGKNANKAEAPYQVSIQIMNWPYMITPRMISHHTCGGGIIAPKVILTAAHCLYVRPDYYVVKAGLTLLNEHSANVQMSLVDSYVKHPNFANLKPTMQDDIAIMILMEEFQFNKYVSPVKLPDKCEADSGSVTITGWGALDKSGKSPLRLQKGNVPILPLRQCVRDLAWHTGIYTLLTTHLCTENVRGFGNPCKGDSGGLAVQDEIALGVVSFGCDDCEVATCPSVYTRVCKFVQFINIVLNGKNIH